MRILLPALFAIACAEPGGDIVEASPAPGGLARAEQIAPGAPTPRVTTTLKDTLERPVTVGCATCHSLPGFGTPDRATGKSPTAFHQALVVDHGTRAGLRCVSCHAPPDYASLRMADGRRVPYSDVVSLCRQCHGPQARDFDHGAHGGMNGYWDLRAGDRTRHACTTCHDPHSPAYAPMVPARGPPPVGWHEPETPARGSPR